MTNETRKLVWRRQFNALKVNSPEMVEENDEKMAVKYPIPGNMLKMYKTLTNFNLQLQVVPPNDGENCITNNGNGVNGNISGGHSNQADCFLKTIVKTVATKKPQGFKVGVEGAFDRDYVLNSLQVWSFCSIFRQYLGIYKPLVNFNVFLVAENSSCFSDELIYKLLTSIREYEDNDLVTYLLNRNEDDFFQLSDWPKIARLLGYKNL